MPQAALVPGQAGRLTRSPGADLRVVLLGRFRLARGDAAVALPPGSQRLLALVALAGGSVSRDQVAGTMWPAVPEPRAHTSLRAALARLGARAPGVVAADALAVSLAPGVGVDVQEAQGMARRLLAAGPGMTADAAGAAVGSLSAQLLPGWYEDWVLLPAEDWRQLRLHALEAAALVLASSGRFGEAVEAARAAVAADPLRESPHAVLIGVHLAEGNQSEALREFARYRALLGDALGLEPTPGLRALLPARR